MITYRSDVTIDRPPDAVFPYLIEPAKQALWSGVPMRQLTDGPLTTGSRMELTFGSAPMSATIGLELTAVEPGRRMAFSSFSGPIQWDGEYRLEPTEAGGTRVEQAGTLKFTGGWLFVEPIVGAEIKKSEIKELEKLKAAVEAG